MKQASHPEKYIGLVAGNEQENFTIDGAQKLIEFLAHVGTIVSLDQIVAGAPGTGAEIPVPQMVADGVSSTQPFQLTFAEGPLKGMNLGLAVEQIAKEVDPFTGIDRALEAFTTADQVMAAVVNGAPDLKALVSGRTASYLRPMLASAGY